MCFKTARWLAGISLGTAVLLAACCRPAAAQDTQQTDQTIQQTGETGVGTVLRTTEILPTDQTSPDADQTTKVGPQEPSAEAPSAAVDQEPLQPTPDPASSGPVAVEAASFKGVTPGVTTLDEVEKTWGAPREVSKQGTKLMQLFSVEPFSRVEVSYFENKVASVVIRFDQAFPADSVAQQLELSNIRPVLVSNEVGEILGQVYPERGVLFAFEPSEVPGKASMQVGQIILEPISAEPFVLRAETAVDNRPEKALQDVQQGLKLDPKVARAHWLLARLTMVSGDPEMAQAASAEAVRLEPGDAQYRVTRAEVLAMTGQLAEATREAQQAVKLSERRPHVMARALCLLGDLAASGPQPDYKKAMEYHSKAVEQAGALATDRHPAIRLAAKEVLVDAHLGAAHDIAWGDWRQKEVAIGRWLDQADAFATDLAEQEGRGEEYRFRVSTHALAAYVGVRGKLDPATWADTAVQTGKRLIAATDDPLRKTQLQSELGMALYDALQTCQMRNDHDKALTYGEWAIEYLEQDASEDRSAASSYLLGRLYFRLGAIHAIRDEDHQAAVAWFDKAMPLLSQPVANEPIADTGRRGETFVSMGVSYWEADRRDQAVQITQQGLTMMEDAVKRGALRQVGFGRPLQQPRLDAPTARPPAERRAI